MGCKFLDGSGNGYTSDAVRCLDYALRMGADITLNSYGGLYADSYALQSAIQAAEGKGQLFVTAAGNDYGERQWLPDQDRGWHASGLSHLVQFA